MKQRKAYDREFKENAVKLSYERSNLSLFARELGITTKQLYSWRSQYKQKGSESFPGKGNLAVGDEAKAFAKLKKEYERLQQEHEILKGYQHHLQERPVIHQFIHEHRYKWRVEMMCRVFKVSRSSYYYWLKYPIGKRSQQIKEMENRIQAVYFKAKGRYGSPRIREELSKSGTDVSLPTVAKYMKRMGLKSKYSRKYKPTTDSSHKEPVANNILNRDFSSFSPSRKCVSDITYLPTKDGFLYLTIVMDLFNRDITGWTLSANMTAQDTVIAAINKAATNSTLLNDMIFHSDRGVQYTAKATVNTLKSYGIIQSMSRKGNCWDNAVAESFFKSLKTELLYGYKLMDKKQMRLAVFEYIEVWYRKQRRHSYLDYQTIEEFNEQYRKQNNKNVA